MVESARLGINHIAGSVQSNAAQIDGGLLLKRRFTENKMEVDNATCAVYRQRRITTKSNVNTKLLAQSIGKNCTFALIDSPGDFMEEIITGETPSQHILLQFPAPTFISGYRTPVLPDLRSQAASLIEKSLNPFPQRVVSQAGPYEIGKARIDVIIVESDKNVQRAMKTNHTPVSLARVKAFERRPDTSLKFMKESNGCLLAILLSVVRSEFCLVQVYDIISSCQLSVVIVEKALSCVRAEWNDRDSAQSTLAAYRSIELVSVDSICGKGHMVHKNIGMSLLHDTLVQKHEVDAFGDAPSKEIKHTVYLKIFFRNIEECYHFIYDDANKWLRNELQYQSATKFYIPYDAISSVHPVSVAPFRLFVPMKSTHSFTAVSATLYFTHF